MVRMVIICHKGVNIIHGGSCPGGGGATSVGGAVGGQNICPDFAGLDRLGALACAEDLVVLEQDLLGQNAFCEYETPPWCLGPTNPYALSPPGQMWMLPTGGGSIGAVLWLLWLKR